jgi:hypothetical protein
VLELRRELPVDRARGPFVLRVDLHLEPAEVHHRLDREGHAGLHALAGATFSVVFHLRIFVEFAADAVTDEVPDDAASLGLGVLLDGRADVAEPGPLAHLGDAELQRLAGHLGDVAGFGARRADVERGRRVAVEALVEGRHVDVDDVAVAQDLFPGDAVADHVVHGRAHALREAPVFQRGGVGTALHRVLVHDVVDVVGRHARSELFTHEEQGLGGHLACDAQVVDFTGALDFDRHARLLARGAGAVLGCTHDS